MRVYDLKCDLGEITAERRCPIAWPVAVWRCYIPQNIGEKVNALEELILSLIRMGVEDVSGLLCSQIGFDRTLVRTVIEDCREKGYISKRENTLILTKDGESMLDQSVDPYDADMKLSENMKVIYMFQDLVTKYVIPCFNIENKPTFWEECEKIIPVAYDEYDYSKPKTAALKSALKYWCRIFKRFDASETPEITFEKTVKEQPQKSFPTESVEKKKDVKEVNVITIYDDSPEVLYLKAYLAIDVNNVDEPLLISPFGFALNRWFQVNFQRLRLTDEEFNLAVELFLEEKKIALADKIAFHNELKLELFEQLPLISNKKKYSGLKAAVEDLYKARNRFLGGDIAGATRDLNGKFGTAVQSLFKEVLKACPDMLWTNLVGRNPDMQPQKNLSSKERNDFEYQKYQEKICTLRNSFDYLNTSAIRHYENSYALFHNAKAKSVDKAYTTSVIALILLNAACDLNSKAMELLMAYPKLIEKVNYVVGNRNDVEHANDGFEKLRFTPEDVEKKFAAFEEIVGVIYRFYLEKEGENA